MWFNVCLYVLINVPMYVREREREREREKDLVLDI